MKSEIVRWIYMLLAFAAAYTMNYFTVLEFQPDKGIIYMRNYEMTQSRFIVTQTELEGEHKTEVVAVVSLKWLNRAKWAIIGATICCMLFFFSNRMRITMSLITISLCILYYVVLIYYAVRITDEEFPTLYPTWAAALPFIVAQMMIFLRKNILEEVRHLDETMSVD